MQGKRGYFEANKIADFFGLQATVTAGNVIFNGVHWHDHVEILLCKKGEVHLSVDGKSYSLFPGDFITINSGESHEITDGKEGNLQIICSIECKALGNMEDKQISCATAGDCDVQEEERNLIREALEQMAALSMLDLKNIYVKGAALPKYSEQEYRKALTQDHPLNQEENWYRYHMYMYQLLMVLVKYKKDAVLQNKKKWDAINVCVLYIHEHLGESLNAEILAEKLHVSEPTIYRLFSEQMGMHLGQYITAVRLNAACRYLVETSEKVIDIAYACGFTGLSNFYRAFQLHVGMSPKAYRDSHRTMGNLLMLNEPDIMKLNRFQSFHELKYEIDDLIS
ncbi:AraC family transcriptional regulator [Anaerobium acetethylicum]|uniref:AraC-type DNA-binding protein n=1 Tax=Anaerobium acetethylicum TaxID=1619234 RepID=A0A1D3TUJ1_9FIRM|nr:AraC family transcriptional regulator [Anaerobium acetethylicum]SCP97724.1 AraC-type DNA-binding protein [Anaerobium acetethylicum]